MKKRLSILLLIVSVLVCSVFAASCANTDLVGSGGKTEVTVCTVRFITGEGSAVSDMVVDYGSVIESADKIATPTSPYYTFQGWYVDQECRQPVTFPYTVRKEVVNFFAKWERIGDFYAVTLRLNGGKVNATGATEDLSFHATREGNKGYLFYSNMIPKVSRSGYRLVDWYNEDGEGLLAQLGTSASIRISKDEVYTAKWEEVV